MALHAMRFVQPSRTVYQTGVDSNHLQHQQKTQPEGQTETGKPLPEIPVEEGYVPQPPAPPPSSNPFPPILTALLVLGVGVTAYGLYDIFGVMTMWPQEVRKDLRDGLKYRNRGEFLTSAQYLARAWETTKSLSLDTFKPHPLLKTTGVAIVLAGVLEEDHKLEHAYRIYEEALWQLRTANLAVPSSSSADATNTTPSRPDLGPETLKHLSGPEKMRSVALAYKLGELASTLHKPREEEEKWLVWAVQAIVTSVLEPVAAVEVVDGENHAVVLMAEELKLPRWVTKHDIAAPFEALGGFYAKVGNVNYALPLYLQAVTILIPPAPAKSAPEDRCRGAQLMGNIAELILHNGLSPEAVLQAESWAQKGLDVVTSARQFSTSNKHDVCEVAYAVLLYNVAMLRELSGDRGRARDLFMDSLDQSKSIGLDEGIKHAQDALSSLDSGVGRVKPLSMPVGDDTAEKLV
ncbi:hypothetical protein B0H34DRAFT_802091 [Crassisporium funariophilum]|nr:hypothetical protein B0H34DRAFT_802091 [Crassisporium funariophilum]